MDVLKLILLIFALACFAIAAFSPDRLHPRVNMIALGLLFWVLVPLISTAQSMN